jgi:glucans biosynthesis protein C
MEPLPPEPRSQPLEPERLHALDAVRAFALLLGIWLHASLSFMPGGYFVIEDDSPSATLRVIFYVIHVFRMSAFFLIAGFFARLVLERRGIKEFIKDRALRIALAGFIGWAACMVLIHFIYAWAIEIRFGGRVTLQMLGWPYLWLTHLWFLYYLLWMYALAVALRGIAAGLDQKQRALRLIDRMISCLVRSHLAPLVAAALLAITLYRVDAWFAWGGIPTPDHYLAPQPSALFGYGIAFGLGWLLQRQPQLLQVWERHWLAYAVAAAICVALSHSLAADTSLVTAKPEKALHAACYALATWTTTLAVLGLGCRFFANPSPVRRYLADASYWLYVAHVPLVFALQTALMTVPLHWSVKFPCIVLVTAAVLLLIYHYGVRSTVVGALMNGRRYPRSRLTDLWQRGPTTQSFRQVP